MGDICSGQGHRLKEEIKDKMVNQRKLVYY